MVKATTFRIDPAIQGGLKTLSRLLGQPVNKLVNEALLQYVKAQAGKMELELQQDVDLLRRYCEWDPDLSRSVSRAAEREMAYAGRDPVEGELLPEGAEAPQGRRKADTLASPSEPDSAQRELRAILGRR